MIPYVNAAQKNLSYAGYLANGCAREAVRGVERLTRPLPSTGVDWREVAGRTAQVGLVLFSVPLAAVFFLPALLCYGAAAVLGRGRFEKMTVESPAPWTGTSLKILSINACFQDPYSPFTGGMVPPHEPVADYATRVAAIVDAIVEKDPVLVMGQEFDDRGAQDASIERLKREGFSWFIRDLGCNDMMRNHSGLFVASKAPLKDICFIPYPDADRAGLAKWANQGALVFSVQLGTKQMRCINVHLNYGEGKENQEARERQLTRHVLPLLREKPAFLVGDLNLDTSQADARLLGDDLTNALAGVVTCTDEGKHRLRGKKKTTSCEECQEKIDGLIYPHEKVQVSHCQAFPLKRNGHLLSDHYAVTATVQLK